jgi:hypothetical protein
MQNTPIDDAHDIAQQTEGNLASDVDNMVPPVVEVNEHVEPEPKKSKPAKPTKSEAESLSERVKIAERWMIALTAITALATLGQVGIARLNSVSSTDQFNQMKSVADRMEAASHSFAGSAAQIGIGVGNAVTNLQVQSIATRDGVTNQQHFFEVGQRPYLVSETPSFLNLPNSANETAANITIRNIGSSPARMYVDKAQLIAFHRDSAVAAINHRRLGEFFQARFRDMRKAVRQSALTHRREHAEADLVPKDTHFFTKSTTLSVADVAGLHDQKQSVYLLYVGVISYRDAFDTAYETEFCYIFFGVDPSQWHICDTHNTIH